MTFRAPAGFLWPLRTIKWAFERKIYINLLSGRSIYYSLDATDQARIQAFVQGGGGEIFRNKTFYEI